MVQRGEQFARAFARPSRVQEVVPRLVVVPQLQSAFVHDDDAAVSKAGRAGDLVEKVALALVGTPDRDDRLFGETPSTETVPRTGVVFVAAENLVVALVGCAGDDAGLLGRAPGIERARVLVLPRDAGRLLGGRRGLAIGPRAGTLVVAT